MRHNQIGAAEICGPIYFPSTTHKLYRNNGNGTFTDISVSSGIAAVPAPGLAVLMNDLDGDGKLDIYVANDLKPAYLFHNQGGGKFVEKAVLSGCGLDVSGSDMAGMGIDAGDLDGSGRPSLFVTNFQFRPNMLYLNRGGLHFQDASFASGLAAQACRALNSAPSSSMPILKATWILPLPMATSSETTWKSAARRLLKKPSSLPAMVADTSATYRLSLAFISTNGSSAAGWPGRITITMAGPTWPSATWANALPCCTMKPRRPTIG